MDYIGDGVIWGTENEEYILNLINELQNDPEDTPRYFKIMIAHEFRELSKELYDRSIGSTVYNEYLHDSPHGFWSIRRVLEWVCKAG